VSGASPSALPNVAEVLGRVLTRVPEGQRALLVAFAERLAAERYRGWAALVAPSQRTLLLACGEREEEIARRVESLHADPRLEQQRILEAHPDLLDINRSVFAARPLEQQFAIQAQGERAGAALWRSLAKSARDEHASRIYLECAELEEASAACLESLLEAAGGESRPRA
jgi:hypothetical protein